MPTPSTKWGKYHENLLKRWAENAKLFSNMHTLSAQYYSKWNKRLGIPIVVIGGITASSIFSSNKEESEVWIYINGGLALVVTALAGVSNFLNVAEKMSKHRTASYKYTKIGMEIDTMLSFAREERKESPQEFIHNMKAAYLEIRENTPEVLSWVIASYINKLNRSITNTTSKINNKKSSKDLTRYIERADSFNKGILGSSDSAHGSITNRSERELPTPQRHNRKSESGEMLVDFTDKRSKQITKVNKCLRKIHDDTNSGIESDLPDDDDDDEDDEEDLETGQLSDVGKPLRSVTQLGSSSNDK